MALPVKRRAPETLIVSTMINPNKANAPQWTPSLGNFASRKKRARRFTAQKKRFINSAVLIHTTDNFSLQSRVAVITGAASGIGLACARLFAREGMKLVLADIDRAALESAVTTLCATGAEAIGVPTDVGDRAALYTLAETTWERFGGAHIVFNNAGVAAYGAATELTQADWEWSLQINLWSAIYGVETFLPRLLAQNLPAHILFTSSFAGLVVSKNMTSYNVAKAAVVALAESLAKDLYKSSIGVSVLCPMRVATNVWETSPRSRSAALGGAQAFRRRPPEVTAGMAGEILDVDYVAERVLDGVRKKTLYIVPHQEARPIIRRKFDKLDASFNV